MNNQFFDIQLVVAMDSNRAIGNKGKMPWHHSEDLKFFKELTHGHPVVMGRKTFESIGKSLPGRKNIVITSHALNAPGIIVVSDFEEALIEAQTSDLAFVIGGAKVYEAALAVASTLWITRIPNPVKGADAFFPAIPGEFSVESEFSLGNGLVVEKWVNPKNSVRITRVIELH